MSKCRENEVTRMFIYHQEIVGQSHNIKTANTFFENVVKFIYLGQTVTKQN
jgi:hypothetical protein